MTKKNAIFCATIVFIIMLLVCGHLYTNKTVYVGGDLEGATFSLLEGEYDVTFTYESDHEFAVAAFYKSNGQTLPIDAVILPVAVGGGEFTYNFKIPISIRNNSIVFRTVEENTNISKINVKSTKIPIAAIIVLILYLIYAVFMVKTGNLEEYFIYTSLLSLLLEPIFIVNFLTIPVWFATIVIAGVLLGKEKITINKNIRVFLGFLGIALLFFEFFSTASPLFMSNTAFDPNVYYSVGAALAHGKKMYMEVFDQKGPLVSFAFLVGYILSPGYFYGVWVIEAISASLGMFFAYRICQNFASEKMSKVVGISTIAIYANQSYLVSGATVEEFMMTVILWMLWVILPFILKNEIESVEELKHPDKKIEKAFVVLGLLSSVAFYSKFNLSLSFFAAAFLLWIAYIKVNPIKNAINYIGGFSITTIPILIYFIVTGGVKAFYHCYFVFNLGYGDVTSTGDTLGRIIKNLYEAFCLNKMIAFLIVLGLAVLVISSKFFTNWGRIILLASFVCLCGGQYSSAWIFPYHFMPIVSYAVIGLVVFAMFIEKYIVKNDDVIKQGEKLYCERISILAVLVLCICFLNNTNFMESIVINKEPIKQEVLAQQMNYYSKGDEYSFFELGFLESGVYQAAKKYPEVQYFFLPNIDPEINAEPYGSQIMYIDNAITDYVIWRGFNDDNIPNVEPIDRNYDRVATYITKDDEFYMIYKKK